MTRSCHCPRGGRSKRGEHEVSPRCRREGALLLRLRAKELGVGHVPDGLGQLFAFSGEIRVSDGSKKPASTASRARSTSKSPGSGSRRTSWRSQSSAVDQVAPAGRLAVGATRARPRSRESGVSGHAAKEIAHVNDRESYLPSMASSEEVDLSRQGETLSPGYPTCMAQRAASGCPCSSRTQGLGVVPHLRHARLRLGGAQAGHGDQT